MSGYVHTYMCVYVCVCVCVCMCMCVCVYVCVCVCIYVWITALFMYIMLYGEVTVFRDEFCFSFLGQTRNVFLNHPQGENTKARAGRQPVC